MQWAQNVHFGMGAMALAAAVMLAAPEAGYSQTGLGTFANKDFLVTDGDWNVPTNWSHTINGDGVTYYVPGSTTTHFNDARIGGGRTATVNDDLTAYYSQLRSIIVGASSNGRLNISAEAHLRAYGGLSIGGVESEGHVDVQGKLTASAVGMQGGWITIHPGAAVNFTAQHQFNINGGTVNFMGGTITDISDNNSGGWRIAGGTVNHSAGISTMSRELEIGGSGLTAVYNLSGPGTINTRSLILGTVNNASGSGTLKVSGGTVNVAGGLSILAYISDNTASGLLEVSGGTVTVANDARVGNPNNTGTATLRVVGNQGSITLNNLINNGTKGLVADNSNAPLILWENGTLQFVIGAQGVSPLNLISSSPADGRSVSFLAGTLDLDLMDGFVPSEGQTFDLVMTNVTAEHEGAIGMDITGLSLAAGDSANWTFDLVRSGDITTLQATYVPEPAAMALVGLGIPMLMGRRRRS